MAESATDLRFLRGRIVQSTGACRCTAVAKMPSRSYNPLFIYGATGIGKTHLMHAIGRSLLDNFGGLNVVYTSSERFMNELIAC